MPGGAALALVRSNLENTRDGEDSTFASRHGSQSTHVALSNDGNIAKQMLQAAQSVVNSLHFISRSMSASQNASKTRENNSEHKSTTGKNQAEQAEAAEGEAGGEGGKDLEADFGGAIDQRGASSSEEGSADEFDLVGTTKKIDEMLKSLVIHTDLRTSSMSAVAAWYQSHFAGVEQDQRVLEYWEQELNERDEASKGLQERMVQSFDEKAAKEVKALLQCNSTISRAVKLEKMRKRFSKRSAKNPAGLDSAVRRGSRSSQAECASEGGPSHGAQSDAQRTSTVFNPDVDLSTDSDSDGKSVGINQSVSASHPNVTAGGNDIEVSRRLWKNIGERVVKSKDVVSTLMLSSDVQEALKEMEIKAIIANNQVGLLTEAVAHLKSPQPTEPSAAIFNILQQIAIESESKALAQGVVKTGPAAEDLEEECLGLQDIIHRLNQEREDLDKARKSQRAMLALANQKATTHPSEDADVEVSSAKDANAHAPLAEDEDTSVYTDSDNSDHSDLATWEGRAAQEHKAAQDKQLGNQAFELEFSAQLEDLTDTLKKKEAQHAEAQGYYNAMRREYSDLKYCAEKARRGLDSVATGFKPFEQELLDVWCGSEDGSRPASRMGNRSPTHGREGSPSLSVTSEYMMLTQVSKQQINELKATIELLEQQLENEGQNLKVEQILQQELKKEVKTLKTREAEARKSEDKDNKLPLNRLQKRIDIFEGQEQRLMLQINDVRKQMADVEARSASGLPLPAAPAAAAAARARARAAAQADTAQARRPAAHTSAEDAEQPPVAAAATHPPPALSSEGASERTAAATLLPTPAASPGPEEPHSGGAGGEEGALSFAAAAKFNGSEHVEEWVQKSSGTVDLKKEDLNEFYRTGNANEEMRQELEDAGRKIRGLRMILSMGKKAVGLSDDEIRFVVGIAKDAVEVKPPPEYFHLKRDCNQQKRAVADIRKLWLPRHHELDSLAEKARAFQSETSHEPGTHASRVLADEDATDRSDTKQRQNISGLEEDVQALASMPGEGEKSRSDIRRDSKWNISGAIAFNMEASATRGRRGTTNRRYSGSVLGVLPAVRVPLANLGIFGRRAEFEASLARQGSDKRKETTPKDTFAAVRKSLADLLLDGDSSEEEEDVD